MKINDIKKDQTVRTVAGHIGVVGEVVMEGRLAPLARVDIPGVGRQDLRPDEIDSVIHQPPVDPEELPEIAKPSIDMDDPREED